MIYRDFFNGDENSCKDFCSKRVSKFLSTSYIPEGCKNNTTVIPHEGILFTTSIWAMSQNNKKVHVSNFNHTVNQFMRNIQYTQQGD